MNKWSLWLVVGVLTWNFSLAYEGENDPDYIDRNFDHEMANLPLAGELALDKTPWASSFWPNVYSGIAFRWNEYYQERPVFAPMHLRVEELKKLIGESKKELFADETTSERRKEIIAEIAKKDREIEKLERAKGQQYKSYFFDFKRPKSKRDILRMSREERAKLSPAEKYDIYVGDYKFTLTNHILKTTSPFNKYWEGICNGWSSAAIEFEEPQAISLKNADGIMVDFGASDLKALLSYYHVALTSNPATQRYTLVNRVGHRCNVVFPAESWFIGANGQEYYKHIENGEVKIYKVPDECVDMNPGAFHIVLANQIAVKNEGFIAEMVRDNEIWNQPIYKFDSKIVDEASEIRRNATRGTVKQITVETKIYYANDGGRIFWGTDNPEDEFYAWWNATTGTENFRLAQKEVKYHLDLDRNGKIIGGMWLSYERADFVWVKKTKGFLQHDRDFGIVNYLSRLEELSVIRN